MDCRKRCYVVSMAAIVLIAIYFISVVAVACTEYPAAELCVSTPARWRVRAGCAVECVPANYMVCIGGSAVAWRTIDNRTGRVQISGGGGGVGVASG